ncbi:glutathione S-transferase family protein [Denitrobaculum tricleocarpae]|uniref:Glutathione S-transferase family protein n=1 Tax=Denitrobaculum tricleocarpae TaxID=2591009 RepID=A0A545U2R7_9PROT|nr:glutathione S-transferase family protein [Denitrobaculum tricleocarpae]TQV83770.1 glutathione S-transferase family protein [Denitrobaculum tricleocarpae]
MLQLYYYPGNASITPHMLLEELGVSYELKFVDRTKKEHKTPEYLALHPSGLIPVLIDGEGADRLVLHETVAVCLHILDRNPDSEWTPALGSPERAQLYKWLCYMTNTIQSTYLMYFYSHRYTTDQAGKDAVAAAAEARLNGSFDILEAALEGKPYLLGEQISVCDLYLLMLSRWGRGMTRPPRSLTNTGALIERLLERPAVKRTIEQEGVAPPFA